MSPDTPRQEMSRGGPGAGACLVHLGHSEQPALVVSRGEGWGEGGPQDLVGCLALWALDSVCTALISTKQGSLVAVWVLLWTETFLLRGQISPPLGCDQKTGTSHSGL